MAYCGIGDLLTGDVPLPTYIDKQKFVDDAADEIDSQIGFRYITPVDLNSPSVARPVGLLLKRLNTFIASARILMNVAVAEEDNQVHAYALRLLEEANAALKAIAAGQFDLEGVPLITTTTTVVRGPVAANADVESNVEAFYNRVVNPDYVFPEWERFGRRLVPGTYGVVGQW